jgi:excisionase family DNA binding protein
MLSLSQVAKRFGVSLTTIRRWVAAGLIQSVQMVPGGKHLFDEKEVERVIQERKDKRNAA